MWESVRSRTGAAVGLATPEMGGQKRGEYGEEEEEEAHVTYLYKRSDQINLAELARQLAQGAV